MEVTRVEGGAGESGETRPMPRLPEPGANAGRIPRAPRYCILLTTVRSKTVGFGLMSAFASVYFWKSACPSAGNVL